MMPTGSFKDRGFSLAVSYAKEIGVQNGFTYSSGNAGASFSAYASRGGFRALVCVEYVASQTKMAMINLYGARTAILEFERFAQIEEMLSRASRELNLYQFVNFINPIRHEAMKTYAYEIVEALGCAPDAMFHPVGTGGGLWGAWKGYCELEGPGMDGPAAAHVLRAARGHGPFPAGVCARRARSGAYGDPTQTIAQSIAADSPLHGGRRILKAVYESDGAALGVSEEEILQALRDGPRGHCRRTASASTVAALRQACAQGRINAEDTVVCVITGSALKQPAAVVSACGVPQTRIRADFDALRALLASDGGRGGKTSG